MGYQYARLKKRDWKIVKTQNVVPVVIGAVESVTNEFDGWIEKLGIISNVGVMQKTALFGTVKIFTKKLEMERRYHSVSLWSFVETYLTEEMTAMTTVST